MNDWNKNGKYDSFDSYVDYNLANSCSNSSNKASSDWWIVVLISILGAAFPPLGFLIVLIIIISGK